MASPVTFVDVTTSEGTLSFSHTVPNGSDRLLLVITGSHNNEGGENDNVTGITYGGVALTQAERQSGAYRLLTMYYLVNPTVGTDTIVVSGTDISGAIAIAALNFNSVNQTTPVRTTAKTSGANLGPSLTLASSVENDLVIQGAVYNSSGTSSAFAPGASQVELADFRSGSGGYALGISSKEGAASVSVTTTASGMGDSNGAMVAISLEPNETQLIEEDFTVHAAMDAWKTPDELAEGFTINASMKAGFEIQGAISEDLTVNAAMSADKEIGAPIFENLTVNAAMDAIATYNRGLAASASIADSIDALATYNRALTSAASLGAVMDAEFKWPVKRQVFPYRAQGKRLSIKIGCAQKGSWIKLLDISTTVLPMVGRTRSQAVKLKGIGNHIGVKISNTDGATLKLAYVGLQIERPIGR